MPTLTVILLILLAGITLNQLVRVFGPVWGWTVGLFGIGTLVCGWAILASIDSIDSGPVDWSRVESVSSESCARCHQEHYDSWYRTYHRTMTREATPENVKGDFTNAEHYYQGLTTRLTQKGDAFFMETVDPEWAIARARLGDGHAALSPPRSAHYRVDRLVGSHWLQECLHRDSSGRYRRLPVLYHITEKRWIHTNGAFLAPDSEDFWDKSRATSWNDTCLYCHNTEPVKNPIRDLQNRVIGYRTEVAELGISCAACHGPGGDHITANQNPARRFALQSGESGDPTIVQPERLPIDRRDAICARCHGALVPKAERWNLRTQRDPYIPGLDLLAFNSLFWSESQQGKLAQGRGAAAKPAPPSPTDGRFWGDGTPLTTALEYNGMALSACYQQGQGEMSCLSCHTMHGNDPNFLLKPGMQGNEACLQCHNDYRERVVEHTRHPIGSAGSQCVNCHMPHQVYSLLTTHRSHRIENPELATSIDTGKPNACVLCHLDKSLGWVRDELAKWPGQRKPLPRPLTADESTVPAGVLMLARGDARTRVMVAGAFAQPTARLTGSITWQGPLLVRAIEADRYPVVRYLAHRALRDGYGEGMVGGYDYLAKLGDRQRQLAVIRKSIDAAATPEELRRIEAMWQSQFRNRNDPDLTINE